MKRLAGSSEFRGAERKFVDKITSKIMSVRHEEVRNVVVLSIGRTTQEGRLHGEHPSLRHLFALAVRVNY